MNIDALKIRNATFSDIDQMIDLLKALFSIEIDFNFDESRQRRGLQTLLDGCGKHRCVRVAEVDGRVVGMCSVQTVISTAEGGPAALVEDLIVGRDYRNKGIGEKLLLSIETWLRERGIKRIQLLVDKTNTLVMPFYRRQGWQETHLICLRKIL